METQKVKTDFPSVYDDCLDVEKVRVYKAGYVVRHERLSGKESGGREIVMKVAYTHDGKYLGRPKWAYYLCKKLGLTELQKNGGNICSIGFSESEQKWYGWSYRAMHGFGIGSMVKKGDCAYVPETVDELYDEHTRNFDGEVKKVIPLIEKLGKSIRIEHKMTRHTTIDKKGRLGGWVPAKSEYQEIEIGRGEWTAETLDDAKLMARDFNSGVS